MVPGSGIPSLRVSSSRNQTSSIEYCHLDVSLFIEPGCDAYQDHTTYVTSYFPLVEYALHEFHGELRPGYEVECGDLETTRRLTCQMY